MATPFLSRRLFLLIALGLLCAALAVHVQGCTILGLAIGGAADARRGTGGPAVLLDVAVGRRLTLELWDGRMLEGRFAGWTRDSAAVPSSGDVVSPRGAVVRLTTASGEVAVPTESIAKVTVPSSSGAIVGLVFGLAADVLVVRALSSGHSHPSGCEAEPAPGSLSSRNDLPRGASRSGSP